MTTYRRRGKHWLPSIPSDDAWNSVFHGAVGSLAVLALILSTVASKAAYIVPTNGLIGYWPGNGIALDLSQLHNNGSFGGSYVSGPPTGGKAFNLATGKVTIPNNAAYNFTAYPGWSVGFWFSGTSINGNNGLFLGQDNGSGFGVIFSICSCPNPKNS